MKPDMKSKVEDFLLGRLGPEEQARIVDEIRSQPDAKELLSSEAAFESLLCRDAWPEGMECDEALAQPIAPEDIVSDKNTQIPAHADFSDIEWQGMINKAVASVRSTATTADVEKVSVQQKHSGRILRFPAYQAYALAAGLLLCITAVVYLNRGPKQQDVAEKTVVQPAPAVPAKTAENTLQDLAQLATNQIAKSVTKTAAEGETSTYATASDEQTVVRLSAGTGVLMEPRTNVAIKNTSSTEAEINLAEGSAVFKVAKQQYDKFEVKTSLATITVTGTSFSTTLDSNGLLVHVIEGAILLKALKMHTEAISVTQGSSVLVTADTLIPVVFDSLNIMAKKESLLREMLKEMAPGVKIDSASLARARESYRELRRKVMEDKNSLSAVVDEYIDKYPESKYVDDLLLELGKNYEAQKDFALAQKTFNRLLRRKTNSRPYQTALYRMHCINMDNLSNPSDAEKGFEKYLKDFPEGDWAEEALGRLVRINFMQKKLRQGQELVTEFLRKFPNSDNADDIAYHCAHSCRLEKNEQDALIWYTIVIDNYPKSSYAEASLYWAGWCLNQKGIKRNMNKFFARYNELYPHGEWSAAIAKTE